MNIEIAQSLRYLELAKNHLHGDYEKLVGDLVLKIKTQIDEHNKTNLQVINPTPRELGSVYGQVRRVLLARVFSDMKTEVDGASSMLSEKADNQRKLGEDNSETYSMRWKVESLLSEAIDLCADYTPNEDYVSAKILLQRRGKDIHQTKENIYRDDLGRETNEFLKNSLAEEFKIKNKESINQIKVNYETSKQQKFSSIFIRPNAPISRRSNN